MPLVSMSESLGKAHTEGYAVPCFDVIEPISAEAMLQAAEEKNSPVIIGVYDHFARQPGAKALAAFVRTQAAEASVPVSLMVDHGKTFEVCVKALEMGFTDAMIDGSRLPLDENISVTAKVVRAAHSVFAACEGEVGQVGAGSNYDSFGGLRKGFSQPADVVQFVNETGVDCVAVAVGTAHGQYNMIPNIDLDLLSDIRSRVDIPLVLHGGSGLSEPQFEDAVSNGVSKVNIFTDLALECGRRLCRTVQEKNAYFGLVEEIRHTFRERCGYYMELFGSAGKAG